jgi:restriction system protein
VVLLSFVLPNGEGLIEGLNATLGGLLLIGIVVAVGWVAWWLWRRLRTPTARELSRRFEAVRSMSGAQFELFVADLFRAMGHQALVLGGAGDQGVDIIVTRRGERVAVQCKNHKKAVGNKPVQEVYAGARHHRCVQACVVAPAGYTKGATDLARSTGVALFDANSIQQWIRKVDKLEGERERTSGTQTKSGHSHTGPAPTSEAAKEARKRAVWHPHPDDPPKD